MSLNDLLAYCYLDCPKLKFNLLVVIVYETYHKLGYSQVLIIIIFTTKMSSPILIRNIKILITFLYKLLYSFWPHAVNSFVFKTSYYDSGNSPVIGYQLCMLCCICSHFISTIKCAFQFKDINCKRITTLDLIIIICCRL